MALDRARNLVGKSDLALHAKINRLLQLSEESQDLRYLPELERVFLKNSTEQDLRSVEEYILKTINESASKYDLYLAKSPSGRDNIFAVLRDWSSATPLLDGSKRSSRGGGYFLKWRGVGIVIDPGFDFIENFNEAGYHISEVDVVIVSHNHPDHNSELKSVDDFYYEFHRAQNRHDIAKPLIFVLDRDTDRATRWINESAAHRIVMSFGPDPINLSSEDSSFRSIPIRLKSFTVMHGEDVQNAVGMKIELLGNKNEVAFTIGYTADTEYFDDLNNHLSSSNMLLAHISQPDLQELGDCDAKKDLHLGYNGVIKLIENCKPEIVVLGEFWAGRGDLRIQLCQAIRYNACTEMVLPSSIGMIINLPSLEVQCTKCDQPVSVVNVRVAPPREAFGSLAYLCSSCMIV